MGDNFYNYDNDNDVNNFCAAEDTMSPADDDDDDGFDGFNVTDWADNTVAPQSWEDLNSTSIMPGQDLLSGDTRAEQSHRVNKIRIHYEKKAKRVNVKQLKSKMWTQLTTPAPGADDKENAAVAEPGSKPAETGEVFETRFTDLTAAVPTKVSEQMAQNLSVPIMFVCLLHLANEKNLVITGDETMGDLAIRT